MTHKLLLAAVGTALAALAFQASAEQPLSPGYDDENGASSQPAAATVKVVRDRGPIGAPFVPYFGDENDTSWVYAAPPRSAQNGGASTGSSSAKVGKYVPYFGDENDTSWVYRPEAR